ncbi:hypothetical protein CCR75_005823 [Bremia lactucae]|uniref:Secreted RxLR effector n=1 Tax=Bremia lactucae TaxID=4779 RepID=A0A976FN37_BRELC|nr:hypothetical protein CCR75_005823 [Bremia lactucae]
MRLPSALLAAAVALLVETNAVQPDEPHVVAYNARNETTRVSKYVSAIHEARAIDIQEINQVVRDVATQLPTILKSHPNDTQEKMFKALSAANVESWTHKAENLQAKADSRGVKEVANSIKAQTNSIQKLNEPLEKASENHFLLIIEKARGMEDTKNAANAIEEELFSKWYTSKTHPQSLRHEWISTYQSLVNLPLETLLRYTVYYARKSGTHIAIADMLFKDLPEHQLAAMLVPMVSNKAYKNNAKRLKVILFRKWYNEFKSVAKDDPRFQVTTGDSENLAVLLDSYLTYCQEIKEIVQKVALDQTTKSYSSVPSLASMNNIANEYSDKFLKEPLNLYALLKSNFEDEVVTKIILADKVSDPMLFASMYSAQMTDWFSHQTPYTLFSILKLNNADKMEPESLLQNPLFAHWNQFYEYYRQESESSKFFFELVDVLERHFDALYLVRLFRYGLNKANDSSRISRIILELEEKLPQKLLTAQCQPDLVFMNLRFGTHETALFERVATVWIKYFKLLTGNGKIDVFPYSAITPLVEVYGEIPLINLIYPADKFSSEAFQQTLENGLLCMWFNNNLPIREVQSWLQAATYLRPERAEAILLSYRRRLNNIAIVVQKLKGNQLSWADEFAKIIAQTPNNVEPVATHALLRTFYNDAKVTEFLRKPTNELTRSINEKVQLQQVMRYLEKDRPTTICSTLNIPLQKGWPLTQQRLEMVRESINAYKKMKPSSSITLYSFWSEANDYKGEVMAEEIANAFNLKWTRSLATQLFREQIQEWLRKGKSLADFKRTEPRNENLELADHAFVHYSLDYRNVYATREYALGMLRDTYDTKRLITMLENFAKPFLERDSEANSWRHKLSFKHLLDVVQTNSKKTLYRLFEAWMNYLAIISNIGVIDGFKGIGDFQITNSMKWDDITVLRSFFPDKALERTLKAAKEKGVGTADVLLEELNKVVARLKSIPSHSDKNIIEV